MGNRYTGSCLCGNVEFSFTGEPIFIADCVCLSCRKAHGASAVAWVGVLDMQFILEDDKGSLTWFSSSKESERGFCKDCGTRVFFRSSKWPGEIHMSLANIHQPHDLVATSITFQEEMPKWSAFFQHMAHLNKEES